MLSVEEVDQRIADYKAKNKYARFHNTYYLYTENMDGEITGEAFGTNLMTDYGFRQLCTVGGDFNQNQFNMTFHVGTGTTQPTFSSSSMESYVATITNYTSEESLVSTDFDTTSRVIYSELRMGYGYLDYNIAGYTEDINITEIGCGYNKDALYFHFLIRDGNGQLSSIVKHPNEKLFIYVHHTLCMHESFMLDPLDDGVYVLSEPIAKWRFLCDNNTPAHIGGWLNDRGYCWYYHNWTIDVSSISGWHNTRLNSDTSLGNSNYGSRNSTWLSARISSDTIVSDHTIEYSIPTTGEIFVEDPNVYLGYSIMTLTTSGTMFFELNNNEELVVFTYDKQPESEEIICYDVYTNDQTSGRIDGQLGWPHDTSNKIGAMSIVDYDISAIKMFNIQDDDWTIDENFICDTNYQSFNRFNLRSQFPQFLCPDGQRRTVWFTVNPWRKMKLKRFTNTGVTVFAADKAWDTSTWTRIDDPNNIPDALSNKQYYVFYSNVTLYYEFNDEHYPTILPSTSMTDITDSGWYSSDMKSGIVVGSDDDNWFAIGQQVFIMNDDNTLRHLYTISPEIGVPDAFSRFACGTRYIFCRNDNPQTDVMVYDIYQDEEPVGYRLPKIFHSDMTVYYDDAGANNDYLIATTATVTNGCAIIHIPLLNVTSTETINNNFESSDFRQGYIDGSTGDIVSNNYWVSTNMIDIDSWDYDIQNLTIMVSGDISGYRYGLWGTFHYYDANDQYLGNSGYMEYNNFNTSIPHSASKFVVSVHAGQNGDYQTIYPSTIQNFTLTSSIRDAGQGSIKYMNDVKAIIPVKGSNYIAYTKETDYMLKWYIADISDPENVITSFEFESSQVVADHTSGFGFSHYVYIRTYDQYLNASTHLFDINTQTLKTLDWNIYFDITASAWRSIKGNSRCVVFSTRDGFYVITEDKPDELLTLLTSYPRLFEYHSYLKYLNNGKQLIFGMDSVCYLRDSDYSSYASKVLDLGVFIHDRGWKYGEPVNRFKLVEAHYDWTTSRTIQYPYKNGIITVAPKYTVYSSKRLMYIPIEYMVPHKTIGTTKTITAYNNPVSFSGKEFRISRTNDMSKLGLSNDG